MTRKEPACWTSPALTGQGGIPSAQVRTASQFTPMAFGGLQMIDPGVVLVSDGRLLEGPIPTPDEVNWYGGIGLKP